MTADDRPLSYWIAVARMGFENDFNRIFDDLGISQVELAKRIGSTPAYISKVLNGTDGNYELGTMAKWARAIGAILQIRLIKEDREAVRVVDYETAGAIDDMLHSKAQSSAPDVAVSNLLIANFGSKSPPSFSRASASSRQSASQSASATEKYEASSHG